MLAEVDHHCYRSKLAIALADPKQKVCSVCLESGDAWVLESSLGSQRWDPLMGRLSF